MNKEHIFIQNKIYPNASDIFNIEIKPLEKVLKTCVFILDTNALLLPYTTSTAGFDEIKKALSQLVKGKQLIIPGQVAREFAKNRPEKIKTLFQQLNRLRNSIQKPSTGKYPLLENLTDYQETLKLESEIQELQKKYSNKLGNILAHIKDWRWNDPISSVYNDLFSPEVIHDLEIDEDKIIEELERRNNFNIPPGFKDKSKEDEGVGDLLIWLTILEIAKVKKKDVVFISGDEKNDWFHRSEGQALYPRFELITEFKEKTEDKSFHIIRLSELLTHLGADEEVVKEVEVKERIANQSFHHVRKLAIQAEESVYNWLLKNEPDKQIRQNRGFPDFIIEDNGNQEGIEVITMRSRDTPMVSIPPHVIQDRFMRAYYMIKEEEVNSFRIFFVSNSEEYARDKIDSIVERFSKRHSDQNITLEIGFLDDENALQLI